MNGRTRRLCRALLTWPKRALTRAGTLATACLAGLGGSACAPKESAPPPPEATFPAGTVLLVDELPLLADEVAMLERNLHALYSEYSSMHLRRLALTNELLPRLAAHSAHREDWARARDDCARLGPVPDALIPREDEGNWQVLGLGLWSAARGLVLREWSAPLELTGRWVRLRLDRRQEHLDARAEVLHVSVLEFPYLDPAQLEEKLDSALDHALLTIIDPTWEEVVPETWKRRMCGPKP